MSEQEIRIEAWKRIAKELGCCEEEIRASTCYSKECLDPKCVYLRSMIQQIENEQAKLRNCMTPGAIVFVADTKPSNPKESVGATKLSSGLVPDCPDEAMAFLEGALKYGRYNWRVVGVLASTYNDALERHRKKWWNGENCDPATRVKHLAYLIACAKILLDAELCGVLTDDRPPVAPVAKRIDALQDEIGLLKDLFSNHNPKQYTIADMPLVK